MTRIGSYLRKIKKIFNLISSLEQVNDEIKVNQGYMLGSINMKKNSLNIQDYEFKIFSQWGEDGIIQHLLDVVEVKNKTFIEFGVESFKESNCRFLMVKNNWKGFVIDGSDENIAELRQSYYFWKYNLTAVSSFITKQNVDSLLMRSGFDEDLGLLSIDIDGNDYYVLQAIESFKPRILICEYNAVFGARKITVPYDDNFQRTNKHFSNLYFGASLSALVYLAQTRGYSLVGVNSNAVNAFFVRNDLLSDKLTVLTADEAFFPSEFREARDSHGQLTYCSGDLRLAQLAGMPVVNVETGQIEYL
jgi:hypothetical protein